MLMRMQGRPLFSRMRNALGAYAGKWCGKHGMQIGMLQSIGKPSRDIASGDMVPCLATYGGRAFEFSCDGAIHLSPSVLSVTSKITPSGGLRMYATSTDGANDGEGSTRSSDIDFVSQHLEQVRQQILDARGTGKGGDLPLLEAQEAVLRVERDLASLDKKKEDARQRGEKDIMVSLEAQEAVLRAEAAMLRVERDLAILDRKKEDAHQRGNKDAVAAFEAMETRLYERLVASRARDLHQASQSDSRPVVVKNHPWSRIAEATIEDLGDAALGMTKLTVPTQKLLYIESAAQSELNAPQVNPHVLIVRSHLRGLLDEILLQVEEGCTLIYGITGTPGIGKTVGSNYLLKRCYDMDRIVITQDLNDGIGWLLIPGQPAIRLNSTTAVGDALAWHEANKPLYLCDTGKGAKHSPHRYTEGMTVLTASPNPDHFGQLMKSGHIRWISPWTLEELEVALPHIVMNYEDTKDLIRERFEEIGGSLRVLLQNADMFDRFVRDREQALQNLSLQKLNALISRATGANNAGDDGKVSHKLIHVFASAPHVRGIQQLTVRFATPRIMGTLMRVLMAKASDLTPVVEAVNLWKGSPGMEEARGVHYEFLFFAAAHQEWRGRSVDARIWDTVYSRPEGGGGAEPSETAGYVGRYKTRPILVKKMVHLQPNMTAADLECLSNPEVGLVVWAPRNWPAVDGWLYKETETGEKEIWLLQHTVASSHKVKGKGFAGAVQHARRGSWSDAKYRLVFVVPSEQVDTYRKKEQDEIGLNLTENQQYIHPWTGEPVQACGSWLPMIDGEPESPLGAEFVAAERFAIRQKDGRRLGGLMKGPDRLPTQVWELEASWVLRNKAARALAVAATEDE